MSNLGSDHHDIARGFRRDDLMRRQDGIDAMELMEVEAAGTTDSSDRSIFSPTQHLHVVNDAALNNRDALGIAPTSTPKHPSTESAAYDNSARQSTVLDDGIEIDVEGSVVTLRPRTAAQCQNLPFLRDCAAKYGADKAGVFKFALSRDFDIKIACASTAKSSAFEAKSRSLGVQLTYLKRDEPIAVVAEQGRLGAAERSPREMATALEDILKDPEQLRNLRYCTDLSLVPENPEEPEVRSKHGFPLKSPIHPLPNNRLDLTRRMIPGVHTPYGYLANSQGGFFTMHKEDHNLWSLNVLYFGEVLWVTVDPEDAAKLEKSMNSKWRCDQKVRHKRLYVSLAKLKGLGIAHRTFIQKPGEVVVVFGNTYHQGGGTGPKLAEAINYAPPDWNFDGYKQCHRRGKPACPDTAIPNTDLEVQECYEEEDDSDPHSAMLAEQKGVEPKIDQTIWIRLSLKSATKIHSDQRV